MSRKMIALSVAAKPSLGRRCGPRPAGSSAVAGWPAGWVAGWLPAWVGGKKQEGGGVPACSQVQEDLAAYLQPLLARSTSTCSSDGISPVRILSRLDLLQL